MLMPNNFFAEFRCGCTSTRNTESSRWLIEVATIETFQTIHDIFLADRRLEMLVNEKAIGVSHEVNMMWTRFKWSPRYEKGIPFRHWIWINPMLFPNWEKWIAGKNFGTKMNDQSNQSLFWGSRQIILFGGVRKLKKHWRKLIHKKLIKKITDFIGKIRRI